MSLSKALAAELRRLAADAAAAAALPVTAEGARLIELPAADLPALRLELFDLDRFSVNMRRLTVATNTLPPPDAAQRSDRLDALANMLINRLSYLEEPLTLVEVDAGDGLAQLRSNPPLREEGQISYWELVISLDPTPALSLARYHWSPELPEREPLPYPAASPQLGRITDTLAGAL